MSTTQTKWEVTPEMKQEILKEAKRYHVEPHKLMRILLNIQRIAEIPSRGRWRLSSARRRD